MDKVKRNMDLLFSIVGVIVILLLLIGADKLLGPLKGRAESEIAGEKFNNFFQAIGNVIREAFNEPIVAVDQTYNQFTNLFVPLLLVVLAFVIAVTICFILCKSLLRREDVVLNKIFVGIWIVIYLGLIYFIFQVVWYLIGLNLKVLLLSVLAVFIVGFIFSNVRKDGSSNSLP